MLSLCFVPLTIIMRKYPFNERDECVGADVHRDVLFHRETINRVPRNQVAEY